MTDLEEILERRPILRNIDDVAVITHANDQLWQYWTGRLGVEEIRGICMDAGAPAEFGDVHEQLVKAGRKLEAKS